MNAIKERQVCDGWDVDFDTGETLHFITKPTEKELINAVERFEKSKNEVVDVEIKTDAE